MALGIKLKDILAERGITVKDFAKQIGVPPTTLYSFIKRDSKDAKLELITKICNGLEINVADFLNTPDYIDEKSTTVFYPLTTNKLKDEVVAIAAHFNGNEYTEEELEEIRKFAEFVKSRRK